MLKNIPLVLMAVLCRHMSEDPHGFNLTQTKYLSHLKKKHHLLPQQNEEKELRLKTIERQMKQIITVAWAIHNS
jgi:hypothetical protein